VLCLLAWLPVATSASQATEPVAAAAPAVAPAGSALTRDALNTRIEQVSAIKELDTTGKAQLLDQYRKAQELVDAVKTSSDAAEAFRRATAEAPAEAGKIRDALAKAKDTPARQPVIDPGTPVAELEQTLQKQKADLGAIEGRLADLTKRIGDAEARPTAIRQRLTEARRQIEELGDDRKVVPAAGETPALAEARRWVAEAQAAALAAEIRMLEEELVSQPMRVELLKAQVEQAARQSEALKGGLRVLEERIAEQRRSEAETAQATAQAAEREAVGKHPLLHRIAEQNTQLSQELAQLAAELEQASAKQAEAEAQAKRVDEDFRSARKKLEVAGLSQALGRALLEQRRALPDPRAFQRKARALDETIASAGLRQIHYSEESQALLKLDAYVDGQLATIPMAERGDIRDELRKLAAARRDLMDKAQAAQDTQLRSLAELDFTYRQLARSVADYKGFLDERLLWVRNTKPFQIEALAALPTEARQVFAGREWLGIAQTMRRGLLASPMLLLATLIVGLLFAFGSRIRQALAATAKDVGRLATDRFPLTLQALGWTLLLAVRWPAVLAIAGAALQRDPTAALAPLLTAAQDESTRLVAFQTGGSLVRSVAFALARISIPLFILWTFHLLCLPNGVGESHFRWSDHALKVLCRATRRLIFTLVPAGFLAIMVTGLESLEGAPTLGLLGFLGITVSLTIFFWQVLHPSKGAMQAYFAAHSQGLPARLRYLWYPLVVAVPMSLTMLAFAGYVYTAGTVTGALVRTIYLVLGLVVVRALITRWLILVERRLRLKALRERRAAERAALAEPPKAEDGGLQIEEPEVDIAALGEQSTKLLNVGLVITGVLAAWGIWAGILPALGVFEEISLWHYTATVDGVEKRMAITLGDLGLSIILIFVTTIAARRLPALLEMVLLHQMDLGSANRFTVTTLTRYAIVIIGAILVFNVLGGSWSEIQWLVAALGVGIGFGLQEIVANFISGLIILFERPLRVGDAVTVGEVSGVVSRIQIRATTITTWDRRDFVVPNKEFITGRLLNWSLTDPITRCEVPVGVDYGADVKRAMLLMADAARAHPNVLDDPKPIVTFESFGDNSLLLYLRCFVPSYDYRLATVSELHGVIYEKFREAGIGIAFPQREVHLHTSEPLAVRIAQDARAS